MICESIFEFKKSFNLTENDFSQAKYSLGEEIDVIEDKLNDTEEQQMVTEAVKRQDFEGTCAILLILLRGKEECSPDFNSFDGGFSYFFKFLPFLHSTPENIRISYCGVLDVIEILPNN